MVIGLPVTTPGWWVWLFSLPNVSHDLGHLAAGGIDVGRRNVLLGADNLGYGKKQNPLVSRSNSLSLSSSVFGLT